MNSNVTQSVAVSPSGVRRFEHFMFGWCFFSTFLATGPQYVYSLFWLGWILVTRAYRDIDPIHRSMLGTLARWTIAGLVLTFASGIISTALDPAKAWGTNLYELYHLSGKLFLRGLIIVTVLFAAQSRGITLRAVAPWFYSLLVLNCIYLVAQRYTGIDWIHGFHTILPDNRFSYGVYRASGFTGHPLSLGFDALLMAVVGLLNFWPREGPLQLRSHWFLLFGLSVFVVILTQSRWPLVVLCFLVAARFCTAQNFSWRPLTKFWMALAVVATIGGGIVTSQNRFAEILDSSKTFQERETRLVFWKVHWQMFLDHPVLGVGYGDRESTRMDYYKKEGYTNSSRKYEAHNIYLQVLADSGLIGLAGLLCFMAGPLVVGVRRFAKRDDRLILFVVAAALCGLMQNTFRDSEFAFAYWVSLGLLMSEYIGPTKEVSGA